MSQWRLWLSVESLFSIVIPIDILLAKWNVSRFVNDILYLITLLIPQCTACTSFHNRRPNVHTTAKWLLFLLLCCFFFSSSCSQLMDSSKMDWSVCVRADIYRACECNGLLEACIVYTLNGNIITSFDFHGDKLLKCVNIVEQHEKGLTWHGTAHFIWAPIVRFRPYLDLSPPLPDPILVGFCCCGVVYKCIYKTQNQWI